MRRRNSTGGKMLMYVLRKIARGLFSTILKWLKKGKGKGGGGGGSHPLGG